MPLPAWNGAGTLPPGVYAAELPDLYDRFVLDAPWRERREKLYAALRVHLELVKTIIPAGKAWIDGSFCQRRETPPHDVDIVIHPANWEALEEIPSDTRAQLYTLLTLKDVAVGQPMVWFSRLQPIGGAVDAYICHPGHERTWHAQWSAIKDLDGDMVEGQEKGYAEVSW